MTHEYEHNPRAYASNLVEDGLITADDMLAMCLRFMSHDDIREMLDNEQVSPRFSNDDNEL